MGGMDWNVVEAGGWTGGSVRGREGFFCIAFCQQMGPRRKGGPMSYMIRNDATLEIRWIDMSAVMPPLKSTKPVVGKWPRVPTLN